MLLGLRAHDLGAKTPALLVLSLKEAGFDCMQLIPHKALLGRKSLQDRLTAEETAELKRACLEHDFKISLLGCYLDLDKPRLWEQNRAALLGRFADAAALGVPYVATETSYDNLDPDAPDTAAVHEKGFAFLKQYVPELAARAHELGVTLLLEMSSAQPLNSKERCFELLKLCGENNLRFIFDPSNIIATEKMAKEQDKLWDHWLTADFVPYIKFMHVKEIVFKDGEKNHPRLGTGVIDFDGIAARISKLKDSMHLEALIREWVRPEYKDADLAFMQSLCAKMGL